MGTVYSRRICRRYTEWYLTASYHASPTQHLQRSLQVRIYPRMTIYTPNTSPTIPTAVLQLQVQNLTGGNSFCRLPTQPNLTSQSREINIAPRRQWMIGCFTLKCSISQRKECYVTLKWKLVNRKGSSRFMRQLLAYLITLRSIEMGITNMIVPVISSRQTWNLYLRHNASFRSDELLPAPRVGAGRP